MRETAGALTDDYISSIPKRRTSRAKQTVVSSADAAGAGQKQIRVISAGNARNIGKGGITYQKVYPAWLAIVV